MDQEKSCGIESAFEYEKKRLLAEAEYQALKAHFGDNTTTILQTNYYFDTDDGMMAQKGITCRIRQKSGMYQLTVKNHCIDLDDCSHEVTLAKTATFDASLFYALGLQMQGELITERTILYKDVFCEMVVDKNTYLGYTDYELEIEYCQKHIGFVTLLLERVAKVLMPVNASHNIEQMRPAHETTSKAQRFFERKLCSATGLSCVGVFSQHSSAFGNIHSDGGITDKVGYNPDEYLKKYFVL